MTDIDKGTPADAVRHWMGENDVVLSKQAYRTLVAIVSRAAPAVQAVGEPDIVQQSKDLWMEAVSQTAFYVLNHCKDGEHHAEAIANMPMPKIYATPAIQLPPGAKPAPEVPPKITLRYERAGNCMWHVGCATSHHARPCKVIGHHETGSLIECAACGKRGNYPNGGIGDQTVDEVPADPRPVVGIVDERYLRPTSGGER